MAEQEQIPHAPENPVADAIIPAAPPAEAAPAADNVPANAENLEVFLVSVSSVPFFVHGIFQFSTCSPSSVHVCLRCLLAFSFLPALAL
jgi:hypothetical protein